jgi:uncharacterized protein involved in exopolysaccharide biosynthesis
MLLPIVSVAIIYTQPRSYQATAGLWALRRYEVIGATGVESDLASTPAQSQATALDELLQTNSFALDVANATSLPSTLSPSVAANPTARDAALVAEISKRIVVTPQGYSLFTISYQNRDPQLAQQVVEAVTTVFEQQSGTLSVDTGKQLLKSYQTQLAAAQQTAQAAEAAQAAYEARHPLLTPAALQNDPQYIVLQQATQQAQAAVQQLQSEIAALNQEIAALQGGSSTSLFSVIDPPALPDRPVSRSKLLVLGGLIGLLGGLLASAVYLILGFRRDRTIYGPQDVACITDIPVIAQLLDVPSLALLPMGPTDTAAVALVGPSL